MRRRKTPQFEEQTAAEREERARSRREIEVAELSALDQRVRKSIELHGA